MKYTSGYKHQVEENFTVQLKFIRPEADIDTWYARLTRAGLLTVKAHFPWDGASGPTIDWPKRKIMVPSCVHDCLAKLTREGYLPHYEWPWMDRELIRLMRERGVSGFRCWYWLRGLALTDGSYALAENRKNVYEVP